MEQKNKLQVEIVKQYPGQLQVTRRVKVLVPGKHFPNLEAAERRQEYSGEAVEFAERHSFQRHLQAWGAPHTGPGIRFVCESDSIDDPDHKGFWTTLALWNRWRHDTYKDDRQAELQYLDELAVAPPPADQIKAEKDAQQPPEIKKHFTLHSTGTHTFGGTGRLAGTTQTSFFFACNKPGCARGMQRPVKQVGTATGQLFKHLEECQPELCKQLRSRSKHSPLQVDEETGEEYTLYSFEELLPHHARFVQWCFRAWRHFYETRSDNGLLEFVRGYDRRANLPHQETCKKLLEVYEELMDTSRFTSSSRSTSSSSASHAPARRATFGRSRATVRASAVSCSPFFLSLCCDPCTIPGGPKPPLGKSA